MIENQLSEPGFLNKFVTEAYTTSAGNVEYFQILSKFIGMQNSQDILLNSLTYHDLTEHTIIYIMTSLSKIFAHNQSLISKYHQIFHDFFLNIFPRYPRKPAVVNAASKLFLTVFRDNRQLAKNILLNFNDTFLAGIFISDLVASTNSISEFLYFFEKVINSFKPDFNSIQNDTATSNFYSIQNFQLFSKMISSFKKKNIPSQLIDIIINIGGPKAILNSVNLMDPVSASEFLISLENIINLPIQSFRNQPSRLRYLIEFIEGTIELFRNQQDIKIISALSFITLELNKCSTIRSLKKVDFLEFWLTEILQITMNSMNLNFLNTCPYCFENWMNFWSLIFEFGSFHEEFQFKSFALNLIEKVINNVFPFLIMNSSKICELFIQDDVSSNLFMYISKMCSINYSKAVNMIIESFIRNGIDEIILRIELSNELINSHSNSVEYNEIFDDIKLLNFFQNISLNIKCNSDQTFELLLISLYKSFIGFYGKQKGKKNEIVFAENSQTLIYYLSRTYNNLLYPNLQSESIKLFVSLFDFTLYPQIILKQVIENSELIQKVIDIDFPFCYEKDKKVETMNFYGYFFNLFQNDFSKISMICDSLLSKLNSLNLIQYTLNICGKLFDTCTKDNVNFIYSYYFNKFQPIIRQLTNIESNQNKDLTIFHNLAKFQFTIASACEKRDHFKFMSESILNLFTSTLEIIIMLLKSSNCDDKVFHFSIMAINSFIQNNSLNIGIMMAYKDFTFNQFLIEFFDLLNSKGEICNSIFLIDLLNFFDLFVKNFNILQEQYFNLFLFFLCNVVIKGLSSFKREGIIKTISILSQSFHILDHLNENNENILNELLLAFLSILPGIRTTDSSICLFYLNLSLLNKSIVIKNVEAISASVLDEDKFSFVMHTLSELSNYHLFNNDDYSVYHKKFQKMLEYIKESLIQSYAKAL